LHFSLFLTWLGVRNWFDMGILISKGVDICIMPHVLNFRQIIKIAIYMYSITLPSSDQASKLLIHVYILRETNVLNSNHANGNASLTTPGSHLNVLFNVRFLLSGGHAHWDNKGTISTSGDDRRKTIVHILLQLHRRDWSRTHERHDSRTFREVSHIRLR
jgi:hypothetical protein